MFNLYQSYKKKEAVVGDEKRADVIGHERFYQRSRSKKKKVTRRSRSAAEFSGSTLDLAKRMATKLVRSNSIESRENPEEKRGCQSKVIFPKPKRYELRNARGKFTAAVNWGENAIFERKTFSGMEFLSRTFRYFKFALSGSSSVPKHEYSALRLENSADSNILEKQINDESFTTCQQYLSATGRYDLQIHLGHIGSRPGKQWFIVKDKSLGADRLLSLTEIPSSSPLEPSEETRETLMDLFRSFQHPYIHPILDLEFWESGAALVTPLNVCGSLKDLIYGVSWQESHERKYMGRGEGLSYRQVQCFGRQILEALLFLQNRSFPKFYHLHAANVIIQNGVARLSALENALFTLPPKPPAEHDCIAFGYILFEMTAGYELPTPPNSAHLQIELECTPKIAETLRYIFEQSEDTPTVEDLLRDELFRGVELRELHRTTGISYTTSAEVNLLLETVRSSSVPTPPRRRNASNRYTSMDKTKYAEFSTIKGKTYLQVGQLDDF